MDVREELRTLTTDAPRGAPRDGIELFRRGRRRRLRRRVAAGAAGLAVVAAAVVLVVPEAVPGGLTIEDNIADQPDEAEVRDDGDGEPVDDPVVDGAEDVTDEDGATATDGAEDVTDDGEDPDPVDEPAVSDVPPVGDEASTADREQEPTGAVALTLTDVRVGTHDGFDRVVLEVEGDGQVGWFITSGTQAIQDGSGDEIEVAGDGVVTVALRGMVIPPDRPAHIRAFEADRVGPPRDAGTLTEVVVGGIFEGQHEVFIGTTQQDVAFRVARLDGPQRLVIDLVHP